MARLRRSTFTDGLEDKPGKPGQKRRVPRPAYTPGTPTPPASVTNDPAALEHWQRLATITSGAQVLSASYVDMLASLALTCADLDRARAAMLASPTRAAQALVERLTRAQRLGLREFGLSPSSSPLVRGAGPTPDQEDPFEAWIARRPRGWTRRP